MSTVLVPVADGSEEIEVVTIVDVLRRAKAEVTMASVMNSLRVRASRGVVLEADCLVGECANGNWDLIALPGGMPGAEHLYGSSVLKKMLVNQLSAGRWVGAICASPAVVLGRHGLILDYRATCNGAFLEELKSEVRETSDDRVVRDRNLVSSQAPGTAMLFALELVSCLFGDEVAMSVAEPMCIHRT